MDKKHKEYIWYFLLGILLVTSLIAFFGGDAVIIGGYNLLLVVGILTPIYYVLVHRHNK